MDTNTAYSGFSLADRLLLDNVNRELDDPCVPTERLFEMLAELTAIAKRYDCEFCLAAPNNFGAN